MIERLDHAARDVLTAAHREAADREDSAVGTEHLLLALASANRTTARLLANAGSSAADVRITVNRIQPRLSHAADHEALLTSIGISAAEIRRRIGETFGPDEVADAVSRVRPRRPRRSLWTLISCNRLQPLPFDYSPLGGLRLQPIPRVRRIVRRAVRAARPQQASPSHLLLALVSGSEPACEILTEHGVSLAEIRRATRRHLEIDAVGQ